MSFKKNKYIIIKKAVSKELTLFVYNYFRMKRQVSKILFEHRYISRFETMFGTWGDSQISNTYVHYADIAMETLLLKCQPLIEKATKLKLTPNYSYARFYKNGDILKRHKDRFSCEVSTTLNLGGDLWPIYLEKPNSFKNIEVNLKPGDMLIYRGNLLEHWRESFEGKECAQVFLHYNNCATKGSQDNLFDKRISLGLPGHFKKRDD